MAEILLRIEGVNFDATMLDTTDLSTVRGASFLYLEAIRAVEAALADGFLGKDVTDCRRLSAGGSIGLFGLTLADDEKQADQAKRRERVRGAVEEWLSGRSPGDLKDGNEVFRLCRHLSFVVDVVAAPAEEQPPRPPQPWQDAPQPPFLRDRERVIAANRLRQMRSPSVVVPQPRDRKFEAWRICAGDQVRPAPDDAQKVKERCVSDSVWERRGYGLEQKRAWYETILRSVEARSGGAATPAGPDYAQDFSEIADDEALREKLGNNVVGKIAVFYADGNGFSAVQDRFISSGSPCSAENRQKLFDAILHDNRRHQVRAILEALDEHDAALRADANSKRRIETLYAAGDEGMWVVPASMGWTLAATFFAQVCGLNPETGERKPKGWTVGDTAHEEPLHVAAGLVFCHHTAPITRIRRLAGELAELAKAHDRTRSLLCYQVLESFDHIGRDVAAFRKERCPPGTVPGDFMLPGDRLWQVPDAVTEVRKVMPRRQLKRLALALHGGGTGGRYTEALRRLEGECPELEEHLPALRACFGEGPALWLHLDELWDFLVVPDKSDEAKAMEDACASGG